MPQFQLRESGDSSGGVLDSLTQQVAEGRRATRELAQVGVALGLKEGEIRLLWLLAKHPEQDQSWLAQALELSAAQVSATVEGLRLCGSIAAIRDASDRRRQVWQLTGQGAEQLTKVRDVILQKTTRHGAPTKEVAA